MTIRHLKIFIKVYETQNMTIAAEQLFMTQPSVSQAIKELESHYHVSLFERLSKKLYVTTAGEKLYSYANHILGLFDDLEQDLQEESLGNHLSVGVNYTVGITMIHEFIHKLKQLHPDAVVHVVVNRASTIKELLRTNQIDLALLEKSGFDADFTSITFAKDRVVIVANPNDPIVKSESIAPAELAKIPLLTREKGVGARDLFESAMLQAGQTISPLWESISITAIVKAVKAGEGVAVLPYEAVKSLLASKELVELNVPKISLCRELAIMYHKNKQLTNVMNDFIQVCQDTDVTNSSR